MTPRAGKPFRIRVGSMTGSGYRVAETLNRHLAASFGYELEIVSNSSPYTSAETLRGGNDSVDLAVASSVDEAGGDGVVGLARLDPQFFFVIVPNDSAVHEFRDLVGPVNPGTRAQNAPPTLGERVVRDILEIVYRPSFLREVGYDISEQSGRELAGWPLHPAAEAFYHRNDPVTADRLGRLSFVASVVAALFAVPPVVTHFRRQEWIRRQRRRLGDELAALRSIRMRIDAAANLQAAEILIREADELLSGAELDGAADLLDVEGLKSIRSLHQVCWRALEHRRHALVREAVSSPKR